MHSLRDPRIFRVGTNNLIVGIVLMVLFGSQLWTPLVHLATGTPMEMRSGRSPSTSITYMSNPGDLAVLVLGWGVFFLLSLSMVLQWLNGTVVADDTGIRARNIFGGTKFIAAWQDFELLEHWVHARGADTYILHAHGRKLKLVNFPEADELIHLVRERSPRVVSS